MQKAWTCHGKLSSHKNRFVRTQKKKAMCAIWDEVGASESEEESSEEEALIYLASFEINMETPTRLS